MANNANANGINTQDKVAELKALGNECVKAENYAEAVLHYSHAIKLDKNSPQLFSNRSHAFLKLQHFYYALQDAKEAVSLDPTWHKAYFRQAEVEYATKHYAEALSSYQKASQIQADPTLFECVMRTSKQLERQQKMDQQIPWVAAGIGLIIGVLLIVADATIPKSSVFQHPVIQVLVTMALSIAGLGLGRCYKWFMISQRDSLLQPPVDLLGKSEDKVEEEEEEEEEEVPEERKTHTRYTKAQARQRFKKGKS